MIENFNYEEIVVAGQGFKEEAISDKVYFNTNFREATLSTDSAGSMIRTTFSQNLNSEVVYLGKSYLNPDAWVYFRVYNSATSPKKLVVHSPHLRSDGLVLYQWQGTAWKQMAQVERATPIAQRSYPFLTFGLPFTVAAQDTSTILLRSVRKTGLNELTLSVSAEKTFIENTIRDNAIGAAKVSCFFVLTFIVLTIGVLFRQLKTIYCGLYLAAFSFSTFGSHYYFDTLAFPPGIALDAGNMTTFLSFIINILLNLYAHSILKPSLAQPKQYRWGMRILILLNVLIILVCLVPPFSLTKYLITNSYWFLVGLNMVWLLYHGLKVFILSLSQRSVKYHLLVFMLVFVPSLFQILLGILGLNKYYPTFDVNYYNGFLMVIVMAYVAIAQFKEDLMSKQALQRGIAQIKESMDLIRRTEIESVGRNLHDQVGNTLASALGYLNMNEVKTEKVQELILGSINELRMISHNLVKDDQRPLSEKVASLADRLNDFASTTFTFDDFSGQKLNTLPKLTQQNLYAIIQELLTNILKHAQAQIAQIQFFDTEGILRIIVEDDGIGFDTEQQSGGIGLQNIRQRLALINGKIMIDSTAQGTTTILDLRL